MKGSILIFGDKNKRKEKTDQILSEFKFSEDQKNNPDLRTIEPEENKKSIGISQVKEAIKFLNQKPFSHKNKVIVISEADLLTTEAQNALLKTLEEPPSYATIILSAKTEDSLLPTMVSRCKKIKMSGDAGRVGYSNEQNSISKILKMSLGERLTWAANNSKEEKEEIIDLLEKWVMEERNNLSPLKMENIQHILEIKNDLENTNVNMRLALEYLVLSLEKSLAIF